jgi:hypothetical protein
MSFYEFQFEGFQTFHRRGNIPDKDVVTFTVLINEIDRGHGSDIFPSVVPNRTESVYDDTDAGSKAYLAKNRLNMSKSWGIGPFEILPGDDIIVAYSGTNISDQSSPGAAAQDRLELDILNQVAKKGVALFLGAGLGSEIGGLFSDAFNEFFEDPVGDFIGYKAVGGCNGPVFVDAKRFSANDLDSLDVKPLTYVDAPTTDYASVRDYSFPGIRFTQHNTDEATHDSDQCGHIAETDVTFAIFRLPDLSVLNLMGRRFPNLSPAGGLRQVRPPGSAFSLKSALGVLP